MPNSTLTVLPDARAKSVSKQHLLGDPYAVHSQDYDPDKLDVSESHRNAMRKKLYVPKIPHQYDSNVYLMIANKPVGTEALSSKYTYADEILPKWESTMKSEYPSKPIVSDRDAARNLAKSMTGTHFVLESPNANPGQMMKSSTKVDFLRHEYNVCLN